MADGVPTNIGRGPARDEKTSQRGRRSVKGAGEKLD